MAQRRNHSKPSPQPLDKAIIDRLHNEAKMSYRAIAKHLGTNYARVYRAAHPTPSNGDHNAPTTTLQRVEVLGEPVSADDNAHVLSHRDSTADLQARPDALAAEVAELKAHRLEVGAWIATLPGPSRDTTQPSAEVYGTDLRGIAQRGVDHEPTWADPDDAQSVPFNLSLPRGLKPLLDAEAKRTGFPASKPGQRLLMAALTGEGGGR